MQFSTWFAFFSVALLATFSPGPAVLLAITNSINQGVRHAFLSSSGNALGLVVVCIVTMIGLGALLKTSATLFLIVKVLGAAYLIYLGVKQWISRSSLFLPASSGTTALTKLPKKSRRRLFQEGLTVALTNPKSILFCTALFPQFMTHPESFLQEFSTLTATFVICSLFSHLVYILLVSQLKHLFSTQRGANIFNKISGTVFIVLGVGLLRVRSST